MDGSTIGLGRRLGNARGARGREREREREGGRERKGADAGKKRAREMSREAMERRGDGLCKQTLRRSSAGSRNH